MGTPIILFMLAIYAVQHGTYLFATIVFASIIPSFCWKVRR